jgi:1,6-anhydro-N-acetylmuramate kinase
LLQGPLLAELLGRPVVFDFRAADLAQGGHGAPLVPATDAALLGSIDGWRALLNLGGIANLTLLPPAHGPERLAPVLGWDCGPANTLLDLAIQHFSEGKLSFDANGDWARRGRSTRIWSVNGSGNPTFSWPRPNPPAGNCSEPMICTSGWPPSNPTIPGRGGR